MYEMKTDDMTKAVDSLMRQMKRYQTACMQENNHYRVAEYTLNNEFLPLMENLILDDIRKGEKHMLKSEGTPDTPLLLTEFGAVYGQMLIEKCRGSAVVYNLQLMNKLPVRNVSSMIEEGNRLIDMVQYFKETNGRTDPKPFLEKYYTPPSYDKLDKFINELLTLEQDERSYVYGGVTAKYISGRFVFEKEAFPAIYEFLKANPDELTEVEFNGAEMNITRANTPIYGIMIEYAAKRKNFEDDFSISRFNMKLCASRDADGRPIDGVGEGIAHYEVEFPIQGKMKEFEFLEEYITDELFEESIPYLVTTPRKFTTPEEVAEYNKAYLKFRETHGKFQKGKK